MAKRNTYFQDEVAERKIDMKLIARVLRYIIPHKKTFVLIGLLMLLVSVVALIPPLVIKEITDVVIPNKDNAQLKEDNSDETIWNIYPSFVQAFI